MQITGGFLAAHAEIVDQKLNVTGGVLDWIGVPQIGQKDTAGNPLVAVYYLITLMQAGPDDHQKPYRMTTEVVEVDGSSRVLVDATIAVDAHSGENRFWVTPFGMAGSTSGRRVVVQTIDGGGSIAIPVEVRVVEPQ
jgi:hypothetical protein